MTNKIEFTEELIDFLSEEYTSRLELLYPDAFQENPDAFFFSNISKLNAYIISGDPRAIQFETQILITQGTGKVLDLGEVDFSYYKDVRNYNNPQNFLEYIISEKIEDKIKTYFHVPFMLDNFLKQNYHSTPKEFLIGNQSMLGQYMADLLKKDGERFRRHLNQQASYFAKDAFRYVYSDLDFSSIIQAVNDEDFEYALNESLAAYDHSLYLAAVSAAGTALENLIIRLLELENSPIGEDEVTELSELTGRLRRTGKINKRDKNRLMAAAKFRNLSSHGNKGRTVRQDAKFVYQEIYNLAFNYFNL